MGRSARTPPLLLSVAWYRFRTTFRHRWVGYVALIALIGLVGGVAMASMAAARRTASSPSTFFASTDPSDLTGPTGILNPAVGGGSAYNTVAISAIKHLPDVREAESQSGIDFLPLNKNGAPLNAPNFYPPSAGNGYGSVDGLNFHQDKVIVTKGRMADPTRADELMLTAEGASALYVHVGSVLPVGIYTNAQTQLPGFGTAAVAPYRTLNEKVVGLFTYGPTIVHDDVDADSGPNNLFTPALTRQLLDCCVNYSVTGIRIVDPSRNSQKVTDEIAHLLPGFPQLTSTRPILEKAQRVVTPEALALGISAQSRASQRS